MGWGSITRERGGEIEKNLSFMPVLIRGVELETLETSSGLHPSAASVVVTRYGKRVRGGWLGREPLGEWYPSYVRFLIFIIGNSKSPRSLSGQGSRQTPPPLMNRLKEQINLRTILYFSIYVYVVLLWSLYSCT